MSSLDPILDEIFEFIVQTFSIDFGFIQLLEKDSFITKKIGNYSNILTEDQVDFVKNLKVPLNKEGGVPYRTYSKKKTFFWKVKKKGGFPSEFDKTLIEYIQLKSFLIVPLIIQNEAIGLAYFTSHHSDVQLTRENIRKIEGFCNQIVGAIYNAKLLEQTETERQKSEKLLLNILPEEVAEELKEKGYSEPVLFESVSVMFTDFKGFTQIAEKLTPQELVKDLDACFVQFDKISERYNLEKLKTIGDSYMCAGGIPKQNKTHAIDCVLAALEIQNFMNMMKKLKEEKGFSYWELRLGIHSGPLVAGVIGEKKFAYDVWGDTVNTASRMESSSTPGKINISGATYNLINHLFNCEYRGEVAAKNKGMVQMYYVNGLKPEYSKEGDGKTPNGKFWEMYGIP
ncbi:MAG: hypothetical protein H7A25_03970 [Leptospiraceae bacterium]|nr:hypothetical protein [Leptospiraceae bacterium]MCP5499032.1 hypothetical protein [Leptospiraceae bacterium]